MQGKYLKNCTCLGSCPCDTIGVPLPGPSCEGLVGMHITQGHFDKVKLDRLAWAASVHWPGALHEGNGSIQPFIEVTPSQAQRDALLQILSGKGGGPLSELHASPIPPCH